MRRISVSAMIIGYLFLSLCAFVYTLTRAELVPRPFFVFFYGMMAPYQGYIDTSSELMAEARHPDGSWSTIDLLQYFPGGRGERTYREYTLAVCWDGSAPCEIRERFAKTLFDHQRSKDPTITAIRLTWVEWPASANGWDAMRKKEFIKEYPLITLEQ